MCNVFVCDIRCNDGVNAMKANSAVEEYSCRVVP